MSAKVEIDNGIARFVAALLLMFYGAFVVMALWGWFVVPLGAPPINMAHAFGLAAFAGMMQNTTVPESKRPSDYIAVLFIKYTLCLVVGGLASLGVS